MMCAKLCVLVVMNLAGFTSCAMAKKKRKEANQLITESARALTFGAVDDALNRLRLNSLQRLLEKIGEDKFDKNAASGRDAVMCLNAYSDVLCMEELNTFLETDPLYSPSKISDLNDEWKTTFDQFQTDCKKQIPIFNKGLGPMTIGVGPDVCSEKKATELFDNTRFSQQPLPAYCAPCPTFPEGVKIIVFADETMNSTTTKDVCPPKCKFYQLLIDVNKFPAPFKTKQNCASLKERFEIILGHHHETVAQEREDWCHEPVHQFFAIKDCVPGCEQVDGTNKVNIYAKTNQNANCSKEKCRFIQFLIDKNTLPPPPVETTCSWCSMTKDCSDIQAKVVLIQSMKAKSSLNTTELELIDEVRLFLKNLAVFDLSVIPSNGFVESAVRSFKYKCLQHNIPAQENPNIISEQKNNKTSDLTSFIKQLFLVAPDAWALIPDSFETFLQQFTNRST